MPKAVLLVALAWALAGAAAARAQDSVPQRGTTYTTDGDVSRFRQAPDKKSSEIYILRGTEAKESQKDSGIVLQMPDASPKAETEPKTKKGFRGRGRVPVSE